jgi:long-chain acyl-CoA synthetase
VTSTHPKVADAAVFGVPNADLGEEVKALVQPMPSVELDWMMASTSSACMQRSRQLIGEGSN